MSIEYFVALPADPPDLAALSAALEEHGGATGSWARGVRAVGVQVDRLKRADEVRPSVEAALRAAKKKPFPGALLVLSGGGADGMLTVGQTLVQLCGGALVTEDGDVLAHRARPARPAPGKAKGPRVVVDVGIPDAVRKAFVTPQELYSLAARRPPQVRFHGLVAALDPRPAQVGSSRFGGEWDACSIGSLVLKRTIGKDLGFFAEGLKKIGLPAPDALYRLSFAYWHIESVEDQEWQAMLGLICGLGRDTQGILHRMAKNGTVVSHDFGRS